MTKKACSKFSWSYASQYFDVPLPCEMSHVCAVSSYGATILYYFEFKCISVVLLCVYYWLWWDWGCFVPNKFLSCSEEVPIRISNQNKTRNNNRNDRMNRRKIRVKHSGIFCAEMNYFSERYLNVNEVINCAAQRINLFPYKIFYIYFCLSLFWRLDFCFGVSIVIPIFFLIILF